MQSQPTAKRATFVVVGFVLLASACGGSGGSTSTTVATTSTTVTIPAATTTMIPATTTAITAVTTSAPDSTIGTATPVPAVQELIEEGKALAREGKHEEAIAVWDEIIDSYRDSSHPQVAGLVATALFEKGMDLQAMDRLEDALVAFEDLLAQYGDTFDPQMAVKVAEALFQQGWILTVSGSFEDGIAVFDELVARFGDTDSAEIEVQVASALYNKAVTLLESDQLVDAIEVIDDLAARFGHSEDPWIAAEVAKGMANKTIAYYNVGAGGAAAVAADELIERFGDTSDPEILGAVDVGRQILGAIPDEVVAQGREARPVCAALLSVAAHLRDYGVGLTLGIDGDLDGGAQALSQVAVAFGDDLASLEAIVDIPADLGQVVEMMEVMVQNYATGTALVSEGFAEGDFSKVEIGEKIHIEGSTLLPIIGMVFDVGPMCGPLTSPNGQ